MAQSLKEWLSVFVAAELKAVIDWNDSTKTRERAIKVEPEERFSDDGSNFRSTVGSPPLTEESKVQILNVISGERPALLLLTDGSSSIRATLSDHALATMETEIEEKLSPDTKGDVFSFNEITVVSTPYGVSEGLVQLHVEDLQYHYHLRKKTSSSRPIERSAEVGRLLEEIKRIRTAQYDDEETEGEEEPASQDSPLSTTNDQRQATQLIATQVPTRKRRARPSLTNDGFEVQAGVNLAKPSAAPQANHRKPLTGHTSATASTTKSEALLGLLGGPRAGAPKGIVRSEHNSMGRPSSRNEQPLETPVMDTSIVRQVSQQSTPRQAKRVPYGRRRIPENQQRLLNRKDSWFPPLPGQQFPSPNVPVELLTRWNAQAAPPASRTSEQASQTGAEPEVISSKATSSVDSEESSDSSSEEEEFTASQWPQSPPARRDMLPPDSTHESRLASQPFVSPQKLPLRLPAKPQNPPAGSVPNNTPPRPRSGHMQRPSTQSLVKHPHPHPPKPTVRSSGVETVIKGTQHSANDDEMEIDVPRALSNSALLHQQRRSEHMRAAQRRNWLQSNCVYKTNPDSRSPQIHEEYCATHPNDVVTQGELLKIMREMFPDVEQPPNHGPRRKRVISSSAAEQSPRPVPQSPRAAQREAWLKANCVYKYDTGPLIPHLTKIHERYCAAYLSDTVTQQGLLTAVKRRFPEPDELPQHGIKLKSVVTPPKRKAKPPTHTWAKQQDVRKVGHLDGADEADDELSDGQEVVRTRASKSETPTARSSAQPKMKGNAFAIYEDEKPHTAAGAERPKIIDRSSLEPAILPPDNNHVFPPTLNGIRSTEQPGPSDVREKSRQRVSQPNGDKIQEDTQGTNTTSTAPATIFEDFAQAWKSIRPGGAFAQPENGRRAAYRKVDVLAWDL